MRNGLTDRVSHHGWGVFAFVFVIVKYLLVFGKTILCRRQSGTLKATKRHFEGDETSL